MVGSLTLKTRMTRSARQAGRLHWTLLGLALVVTLLHLWLTHVVVQSLSEPGQEPGIKKMEAIYATEMRLSAPPVARAATVPTPAPQAGAKRKAVRKPPKVAEAASAASQPDEPPKLADAAASAVAEAPAPIAAASAPEAVAAASAPPPPAPAPSQAAPGGTAKATASNDTKAPTFIWPKATRVSYKMEGNFRGPIYGQASVEWLREGSTYQVFVEASVGPSFAPLGSWRLSSQGEIRPEGLYPRRYENMNRMLTRSSPVLGLQFDDDEVTLSNGGKIPRKPGMQDPASQFIQLAYSFMLNPLLLMPGNTVYLPMVWLKKSEVIAYDVLNEEVLRTPLGDIPTYHVRPRRAEGDSNNMSAEIWFAPSLQYLPVRILTRANEQTFMDMQMDKAPQQVSGEPGRISPRP
jgi:hypothetical protein